MNWLVRRKKSHERFPQAHRAVALAARSRSPRTNIALAVAVLLPLASFFFLPHVPSSVRFSPHHRRLVTLLSKHITVEHSDSDEDVEYM